MLLGRYTLSATCTGYYGYGLGGEGAGGAGGAAAVDVSAPGGFEHAKAGPRNSKPVFKAPGCSA